ncbi:MAG: hypothetical protein HOB45_02075, partial [Planctomycetaceae bacterium]|nr:hypothetical protein [Planctomycetaceae bacterium]
MTTTEGIDSAGTANLAFLEELFAQYQNDPESLSADWRQYFDSLVDLADHSSGSGHIPDEHTGSTNGSVPAVTPKKSEVFSADESVVRAQEGAGLLDDDTMITPDGIATGHALALANGSVQLPDAPAGEVKPAPLPDELRQSQGSDRFAFLQDRVDQLVRAYRVRGHLTADIDPLGRPRPGLPELDPAFYDLTEEDMDRVFSTDTIEGPQSMSLRQIIRRLHNTYCRSIGVQFMHMDDLLVRQWLQVRMEGCENRIQLDRKQQLRIYRQMTTAAVFEEFIQKRFLGSKSFSLEGSESLIPLVEMAIERGASQDIQDVVMAMAHRGRLNVLANIMRKSPQRIFREFADLDPELHVGRGDVKYHLGHSTDYVAENGR